MLTLPDGRRYEGEWVDETYLYEGDFNEDGEPDGQCVMTWPSGSRYEGEWIAGEEHGRGVLTLPDGQRYEGELKRRYGVS